MILDSVFSKGRPPSLGGAKWGVPSKGRVGEKGGEGREKGRVRRKVRKGVTTRGVKGVCGEEEVRGINRVAGVLV